MKTGKEKKGNKRKGVSDDTSEDVSKKRHDLGNETAETKEEIQLSGEKDNIGDIEPEKRRLDSFADLLSNRSECVAVLIVNNKILVSANEFFKGKNKNEKKEEKEEERVSIQSIKEIFNYFKDFSYKNSIETTADPTTSMATTTTTTTTTTAITTTIATTAGHSLEKDIFLKTCSPKRFKTVVPDSLKYQEIVADAYDKRIDITMGDVLDKYKNNVELASRMYGKFMELSEDFSKVKEALSGTNPDFSDFLSSLQNNKCRILQEEDEEGIHAEVQILAYLIKNIEKYKKTGELYIGISKLCCLHCHYMLEAANDVFDKKQLGIKLFYRGAHDLTFKKEWKSPKIFFKGYKAGDRHSPRIEEKAKTKSKVETENFHLVKSFLMKEKPRSSATKNSEVYLYKKDDKIYCDIKLSGFFFSEEIKEKKLKDKIKAEIKKSINENSEKVMLDDEGLNKEIYEGIIKPIEEKLELAFEIGKASRAKIDLQKEEKEQTEKKNVNMRRQHSDSESMEMSRARMLKKKKEIQEKLESLQVMHSDDLADTKQACQIYSIAISLYDIKKFRDLHYEDLSENTSMEDVKIFLEISNKLCEKYKEIGRGQMKLILEKILRNKFLVDEKISKHFKSIDLNRVIKEKKIDVEDSSKKSAVIDDDTSKLLKKQKGYFPSSSKERSSTEIDMKSLRKGKEEEKKEKEKEKKKKK